jgi:hypothetical protein
MTPEEFGIFNVDSHMKHLIDHMQSNDIKEFYTAQLPAHFNSKWMKRAQNKGFLLKIKTMPGDKRNIWTVGGKYKKFTLMGFCQYNYGNKEVVLTEQRVEEAINKGLVTGTEMAKYVGINRNTALKYLKRYRDAGLFAWEKIGMTYHYSLKEA